MNSIAKGQFTIHLRNGTIVRQLEHGKNTMVYSGMDLIALMLAGLAPSGINAMYLEFENNEADPDNITIPTINLSGGRSYYTGLELHAASTQRDYLRIGLAASPALESTDSDKFENNKVRFVGTSLGVTVGEGGLPFSVDNFSTVYGIALVNAPDTNDRTQDVVLSRSYDFTPKALGANEQIWMSWELTVTEEGVTSSSSSSSSA